MANRFLSNIRINDAYTFPASDGTNGQVIKTDGSGNLTFGQLSADSASVMYKDTFTGDGSTTGFTLSNALNDEVQSNIYIDGVYQSKSTYSVSGTAITFSTAPLSGHEIEVISTTGINSGPTAIFTDTFTANGSATAFTLGQTVHSENQTIVFLNGVYQFKGTYTLNGTTLTLDTAPANGVSIEVMSIGSAYSGGDILYDHDFTSAGLMTSNGSGVYSITANNSTNWNTAYGWGDHSTQSYATQSYVGTQISNLVDSSPATLDTLNELAAALGDDPNFATTTATSIGLKAPKASPSFTGNAAFGGDADVSGTVYVGGNNSLFAENNLRFKSSGTAYIDHNTVGQSFIFRTSASSSLDTTALTIASNANATFTGSVEIRSGNKLILQRPNNAVATEISTDSTGAMVLNSINSEGFFFNNNGNNIFKLDPVNATFAGDVTANGDIIIDNSSGDPFLKLKTAAQEYVIRIDQSDSEKFQIRDVINSATRMTIDSSGNVGIGTDDPASKLTVVGKIAATASDGAYTAGYFAKLSSDYGPNALRLTSRSGDIIRATDYGQSLSFLTGSTTSVKMFIASSGNVGIGTDDPNKKLHIVDTNAGAVTYQRLENSGTTVGTGVGLLLTTKTSNGGNATSVIRSISENTTGNSSLIFTTPISGSTAERMRINSSGNVGIGNTSPDEKLEISGTGSLYPNIKFSFPGVTSRFMKIGMATAVKYEFEVNGSGTYMVFKTEGVERMQINSTYVKIAQDKQLRIGDYFHLGSGNSSYMGSIGFNRDTSNGTIFNSSYSAYQIHNYQGTLKLQVYSSAGGTIGEHKFFNNGDVSLLKGISFNGDTAAANALDDYEEGTFTPDLGGGTYAYTNRRGHYVKVGNIVHIHIGFRLSSASPTSATASIGGLPFSGMSWGSYQEPHQRCGAAGELITANLSSHLSFYVTNSGSTLYARTTANNADNPVAANAIWKANSFIKLQLSYTVS